MKPTYRFLFAPVSAALIAMSIVLVPSPAMADAVEEAVREIRSLYNTIEGKRLRSAKIEFETQDEPIFGTLTRYYDGVDLVKAHLSYGVGDHGATDAYFYYRGGELFFVFASDGTWMFTGATLPNGESETIDAVTEHRLYLSGGRLVRHLTKEAKSKNPDQLKGLIAKAANVSGTDSERAQVLVDYGQRAYGVTDKASLGGLLSE